MAAPDPCREFIVALHEDKDRISDIVHEKIVESKSFAINAIPDGGVTQFNDNKDHIEYRAAKQASRRYDELNDDPRSPLVDNGKQMAGRGCDGITNQFDVTNNQYDAESSCHDAGILDFGQGFKLYSSKLFRLAITTPVVCAFDFIRMGPEHVEGYFKGMTEAFTDYGMENFEANLQNFVITYGEANASVNSKNEIVLTTGGFNAPPTYRLSIPFLRRYRQYMIREGGLTDEGLLEIDCTRQDALDAIAADQAQLGSPVVVNEVVFQDTRGAYYNKPGVIWNGIKFMFNEMPVRGYFMPTEIIDLQQNYKFVRVYHWVNEVQDDGGLGWEPNHDYDKSSITCNGVSYPMCTLAFVINTKSFMRYGLGSPKRILGQNAGSNFEMIVLDGSHIECNDFNDKFRVAARHMFRFKTIKPQLSGAIAYRHATPEDYVIMPVDGAVELPDPAPAGPAEPEDNGMSPCCPGDPVANTLNVDPCCDVTTIYDDEDVTVRIGITREGSTAGTASMTIGQTPDTATTPAHYTANTTAVAFADGEYGTKYVDLVIVGVLEDAQADECKFTLDIGSPSGTGSDTIDEQTVTINIIDANYVAP